MREALLLLAAYAVDRLVGDPRGIPHPVVVIGWCITRLESVLRLLAKREQHLRAAGVLFPVLIVGGSFTGTWLAVTAAGLIHPWLASLLEIWLISTTIAAKGLAAAGMDIYRPLRLGETEDARRSLAMVVGRDTERLDEPEICRGAVETVAENIVDAVVSPLFYAAIGGAPLAMAYRAANTLDSMVGYKNERYQHLGWASAKFDDLLNFIPARLTALLLVAASWWKGLDWRRCWRTVRRDARLHPSPNSGWPEAAVAGALGVQLGGLNYYQGVPSHRARLGDPHRPLESGDIRTAVQLMKLVSTWFALLCAAALWLIHR
jgi:adenosylcobinamide-phosphate synthase